MCAKAVRVVDPPLLRIVSLLLTSDYSVNLSPGTSLFFKYIKAVESRHQLLMRLNCA